MQVAFLFLYKKKRNHTDFSSFHMDALHLMIIIMKCGNMTIIMFKRFKHKKKKSHHGFLFLYIF
ncbi:hypothetical protein COL84_14480 [Bacillus pseudomycoides]|nr:hypothetical protein CN686_12715 [Bacillus pseudomycoides]PEM79221.1 hypothetical protein CN619_00020 [Bacillus pseudomycoides]PGA61948.1 hypothetical protein COL84_14480 [Bacillus pseudomycoides]PHA48761.1 hypothetical protein COE73_16715 [Bacillus pseudomycoides]PHA65724.1 hypothetical protein COE76_04370 [Bacillus pseudomycoides]